jgi:hypothetical protein
MNLVKEGTAAVVGLASGALETQAPVALGGQSFGVSTILEAVAFVGGTAMQFLSPYTAANIVDGAVDGSIALLGRRAGKWVMTQTGTPSAMIGGMRAFNMPMLAGPGGRAMNGAARSQVGSISNLSRYSIT